MIGRPSDFTPEIANEICERLAKGESLRKITGPERDDFMPAETTVRRWLAGTEDWNDEFRRQYARAREDQADFKFEEAWEIASKATAADVAVARLQVDVVKWQAGKLAPKKYGDRTVLTGDADGDPIKTALTVSFV